MIKRSILAGLLFCSLALALHGAPLTLKEAFKGDFLIGAALNPSQFCESNQVEAAIVKTQFDSITPENVLKWEMIHPRPGRYNFTLADKFVAFGVTNSMFIVGHTLIWHSQTPAWVFQGKDGKPATREVLLQRMRQHIFTVVGRYKGKINGWDVVNEAIAEDGSMRNSPWRKIIGDDFIEQAFRFAHEADPDAELYYNDYGLENPVKRAGALAMLKNLQAKGVKIFGVGIQGHYQLAADTPSAEEFSQTISDFAKLGLKVMITELDVDVLPSAWKSLNADVNLRKQGSKEMNPYTKGLPGEVQAQLAARYAELFGVMLKYRETVTRVTLWGVTDGNSWLNDWPIRGRTSYPLFFDREGKAKAAFYSVLALTQSNRVSRVESATNHSTMWTQKQPIMAK
jgi:endo-1,4-beta-xylanase